MEMRCSTGRLAAAALFAVAGLLASARAELAASSPFMPIGDAAKAGGGADAPSGPIELRGLMQTSDGASFCIYDTAKKKAVWVGLNEAGHDFTVRSADPSNDTATVDYQGRSLRLVLKAAKVAGIGTAAQGPNPAVTGSVAVNPTPADEQRRLDAVAQEVRRRRMERERAIQDTRIPGPGALPPPAGR